MRIAIRVDASAATGSGHVMRTLSLADALLARGDTVEFVSRDMPAHLATWVENHGHRLLRLPGAMTDEQVDAMGTLDLIGTCDWIVVDHYGLGAAWERTARTAARLLVVDDLGRPHDCDVLLDQNLHPQPDLRYLDRVPPECVCLFGPRFALLRAEFSLAHRRAKVRDGNVRRLLVFLGGMDANNVTEQALLAVASTRMQGLAVDVVIGASHPARERVRALCDSLPDARCHVQTTEIVDLLAAADIAIGAGGTATWERCALGVPTLALCIADNQRELLTHASRAGLLCTPDPSDTSDPDVIAVHLRSLLDNSGLRHHLSSRGMELVDGDGARRVASVLQSAEIVVRLATAADGDRLYAWRNHPDVRKASRDASEIDLHAHRQWLDGVLASDSRHLLIGERASEPIGVVRFDVESDTAEVSIYLVAQAMGRGHGQALLRAAEHWLRRERPDVRSLRAHVHAGNGRSQRLFEQCGYIQQSADYEKGISR